jgi:putative FmdB family regulatory protein
MPTYTYECKKCGSAQDEFHGMNAAPAVKCGSCGSKRMRKLQGMGAGIIFKGSGFYETDYKRKGANGSNGGSNGTESKGDSGGGSKSESKPESGSAKSDSASKSADSKKATPAAAN